MPEGKKFILKNWRLIQGKGKILKKAMCVKKTKRQMVHESLIEMAKIDPVLQIR